MMATLWEVLEAARQVTPPDLRSTRYPPVPATPLIPPLEYAGPVPVDSAYGRFAPVPSPGPINYFPEDSYYNPWPRAGTPTDDPRSLAPPTPFIPPLESMGHAPPTVLDRAPGLYANPAWMVENPSWGVRADGTPKGAGYFGPIQMWNGDVMTELSIGVPLDGVETEIPLIVSTSTQEELDHLAAGGVPSEAMVRKAIDHARMRRALGLPVWATDEDRARLTVHRLGGR